MASRRRGAMAEDVLPADTSFRTAFLKNSGTSKRAGDRSPPNSGATGNLHRSALLRARDLIPERVIFDPVCLEQEFKGQSRVAKMSGVRGAAEKQFPRFQAKSICSGIHFFDTPPRQREGPAHTLERAVNKRSWRPDCGLGRDRSGLWDDGQRFFLCLAVLLFQLVASYADDGVRVTER